MTAQHNHEDQPADPVGPIELPERSRIGARAFALVGAASVLSVGLIETNDIFGTYITTISHH
ncbi:hypothetical protein [Kribbella catacumbae]|uniref:hypothetical protein n=1 Tax=Kribbella catacumbae TaxID=460086 RepID=UPI000377961C|nr:hypothetical protein [Kribbella catacumbae]